MTQAARVTRILIVDDSAVMRSLLRSVVMTEARLEVVGTASNGEAGLRAMESLHPDLVLLDVEMPVMDGLNTLRQMRARGVRVPVIMCSTLTQRGAQVTIEALATGAADYVAKPAGQPSREAAIAALAHDLVPKIVALTEGRVQGLSSATGSTGGGIFSGIAAGNGGSPRGASSSSLPLGQATGVPPFPSAHSVYSGSVAGRAQPIASPPRVVVIGVSTGGPAALDVVLPALPASFPLPVLVVQHMPELFTKLLAERLDSRCALHVREAVSGEAVQAGTIYIAKGNWHMEMLGHGQSHAPTIRLTQEAPENHCRPAADVLFRTAVSAYGGGVLGVVLTGMGSDGLAGSKLIRGHHGSVLAQDQATSAVWGMPGAVSQAGLANRILPLAAIAPEILRLAGRGQREAMELRETAV